MGFRILPYFNQGPVVQSIVSLTNSLIASSLAVIAKVFLNILIFCCKNVGIKATHIFAAKISIYLPYFKIDILTSR